MEKCKCIFFFFGKIGSSIFSGSLEFCNCKFDKVRRMRNF